MINRDNLAVLTPDNIHQIKPLDYLYNKIHTDNDKLVALHFNPDNRTLTSVKNQTYEVALWNLETQIVENSFQMFGSLINIFSPCGRWVAYTERITGKPQTLYVRCMKTGDIIFSKENSFAHRFMCSGNRLLYLSNASDDIHEPIGDEQFFIVELETQTEEFFISIPQTDGIYFDETCQWYVRTTDDQTYILDFTSHKIHQMLFMEAGTEQVIRYANFSPDGEYLLLLTPRMAELWQLKTGRKIKQFDRKGWIYFSLDSQFLVHNNIIWNIEENCVQAELSINNADKARYRFKDQFLFNVCESKIYIFNPSTGQQLKLINNAHLIDLSPDGKLIATSTARGIIYLWGIKLKPEPEKSLWQTVKKYFLRERAK